MAALENAFGFVKIKWCRERTQSLRVYQILQLQNSPFQRVDGCWHGSRKISSMTRVD
ncbi:hypothetical protein AGR6A_Cc150006 [Agrobacterium sp. NCPPB 925]|nr:hypothetical protein AGR6A_Cc150006 [Agrobacterium sp. NCPPB 925]